MRALKKTALQLFLALSAGMVFLLSPLPAGTQADEGGESGYRGLFHLPGEITDSYFPGGRGYLIPESPRAAPLMEDAEAAEKRGDFLRASRSYLAAGERVRGEPAAPYLLFKGAVLDASLPGSIAALRRIIESCPTFPLIDAVRYELAERLYLADSLEEAAQQLGLIAAHEEKGAPVLTPYARTFLAQVRLRQGAFEPAIRECGLSLALIDRGGVPGAKELSMRNHILTARALLSMEEYEKGTDLLLRILGTSGSDLDRQEALLLLGDAFSASGSPAEARSACSQLAEDYPTSLFALQAKERLKKLGGDGGTAGTQELAGVYDPLLLPLWERPGGEGAGTVEGGKGGSPPSAGPEQPEESGRDRPAAQPDRLYFIQLGSFSEETNAENLTAALRDSGYAAFVTPAFLDGKRVWRVRMGGYQARDEADRLVKELQAGGYVCYVVSGD
jgi:tetratricopeptide (TPR) repeat protein